MASIGEYIFRLSCCCILTNIVLCLFSDGNIKKVVQMVSGIFLTIIALSPFMECSIPELGEISSVYFQQGKSAALVGDNYAQRMQREIIKANLEAYILDKAQTLGCDIIAEVEIGEGGCPASVTISGLVSKKNQKELAYMLTKELGIAEEDQYWNG